jgi:DNA-binding Lrp family transcriptional regulator
LGLSDEDWKILRLLLQCKGSIHSNELAQQTGLPVSTVQRRRKRLEEMYLVRSYSLNPLRFGWRRVDFLIATEGGSTLTVGRELLKREEVTYVARSIGEHTIDLRVETFVRDNIQLLNILEEVKAMDGVKDVVWSEIVEIVGTKAPPNHIIRHLADSEISTLVA